VRDRVVAARPEIRVIGGLSSTHPMRFERLTVRYGNRSCEQPGDRAPQLVMQYEKSILPYRHAINSR